MSTIHTSTPTFLDYLTSDGGDGSGSGNGKRRLVIAASSPNWREFIPSGFETLSRLKKDFGCGLSINAMRTILESGNVPMHELYILTPPNAEGVYNATSYPTTNDNEYKLLTSNKGALTFDREDECTYLNGSRFSGLNPYVVTVFNMDAAIEFLAFTFLPAVQEVRPYVFRHPEFKGAESRGKGLSLDPAKVFRTFHVDVVKRENVKAEVE